MSESLSITVTRQQGYQFLVDFGAGMPDITADLPAPLGQGAGPSPEHLLGAAVANCLGASLLFSLQKYKQDPGTVRATATLTQGRNAEGRLRVTHIDVAIELEKPAAELQHLERVLAQFESFCTVTQSVKTGIDVAVNVRTG
ncbi:MAG: OsmC family protein [Hydrogenophaga sp.]|jgi:uncharacterized OsmC-like protein|uniref:OsmC family protein n=1 Tax=Hydrogenophaga intermedia TaxID=65786 RepID=UPI002043D87C|nr:OsmC family protein [Hydrogenophaga intermedia]MCM3565668.1 OsmC family protein [Hydrogenophaga intermedia]